MAIWNQRSAGGVQLSAREHLERRYQSARTDLMIVVVLTLVNLVALLFNIDYYFLFSASIPYWLVLMGKMLCGMMPDEYYTGDIEGFEPLDSSFFAVMLILALIGTALYFVSWLLSKKHRVGWLIFALVFFAIDTVVFLLVTFSVESLIDLIFHAWFIFGLARGIHAYAKLKRLPEDEPLCDTEMTLDPDVPTEEGGYAPSDAGENPLRDSEENSPILYPADSSVKCKVLLETNAFGHDICYRRVKRRNELVIDGNVYNVYEALVEQPHTLSARFNGREIAVGFDGTHSYIEVDGELFKKKLRLV